MRFDFKSFLIAWLATFAVVSAGMAGLGVLWGKKRRMDLQRGWSLQNVVVAARDLPRGTILSTADLTTRQVPEQLVVSALHDGELTRPIGKRLTLSLHQNDLISPWMYRPAPLMPSCQKLAETAAKSAHLEDSPDVKEALDALAAQLEAGADGGSDGR